MSISISNIYIYIYIINIYNIIYILYIYIYILYSMVRDCSNQVQPLRVALEDCVWELCPETERHKGG